MFPQFDNNMCTWETLCLRFFFFFFFVKPTRLSCLPLATIQIKEMPPEM